MLDIKIFGDITVSGVDQTHLHIGVAREGSIDGVLVKTVLTVNEMVTPLQSFTTDTTNPAPVLEDLGFLMSW